MKKIYNDGFTLIEILISIVLISTILYMMAALLPGYKSIVISGNKSVALYEIQEDISEEIATAANDAHQLNINFESQNMTINGEFIQISTSYKLLNGNTENIQINYFKPTIE